VIKATLGAPASDKTAMREAAELAASEESARWFRKIDVLNVIGNLGPLIGLAGTVYGMILAFTSLGEAGGQAGPGDLSLGISKALFHTLLGLCLAIPCLLVYGLYRGRVDRLCTRGIVAASEIVELIPVREANEAPVGGGPRAVIASTMKVH
jgi:biopolymer transport protein ExbB